MKKNPLHWIGLMVLVLLLASLACGPGGEPTATPEAPPPTATKAPEKPPTPEPAEPTPTPEPVSLAITSLQDVKNAVIQIEAQGSFVDPQVGLQLNAAGFGSGFIIDESGIAVTNNHVVTGAALLRVYVGGDSEPRNARVLGASECSDLAVIDLEGEGYPYLEWHEGAIPVGLDVYAAGFPLGDPEYTLTRGIVSKERAGGESDWASVDYVIEHDATINPGNSGGPLVSADGKVVGVNYASAASVSQYFAIARDEALEVIDLMRAGQDVTSIGVNGMAVWDGSLSGIWVSSVKSGSPADRAGVQGGDIITAIEGFVLATDGTMADYCDILRSHNPDDVLAIEVLRFSTEEYLAGQLNGRELEQTFSFAAELGEEVGGPGEATGPGYSGYTMVTDDLNAIQVEIPLEWGDFNGTPWTDDGRIIGAAISASSNLDDFRNTFSTPGVWFGASEELAYEYYDAGSFLDALADFSDYCVYEGRFEYEDPAYSGLYDWYSTCGSAGSSIINVVAFPSDYAFLVWVQTQVVDDADLEALDRIWNSFYVIGELPSEGSSSGGATASGALDGDDYELLDMGSIFYGEVRQASLPEGQFIHLWTFDGVAGDVVTIIVSPVTGGVDLQLALVDSDGNFLWELDDGVDDEMEMMASYVLPATDSYGILAAEYWEAYADYEVSLLLD